MRRSLPLLLLALFVWPTPPRDFSDAHILRRDKEQHMFQCIQRAPHKFCFAAWKRRLR
jgi:hypothetical protein